MCFRHDVTLKKIPATLPAVLAADSVYWFWINGLAVVEQGGLKRGPTPTGSYADCLDLASHLRPGTNQVAALVWYFGIGSSSHMDSGQGGFLLDAPLPELRTSARWRVRIHPGYDARPANAPPWRPLRFEHSQLRTLPPPPGSLDVLSESVVQFDARADQPDWLTAATGAEWRSADEKGVAPAEPWGELVARPIPQFRMEAPREYLNPDELGLPREGPVTLVGKLPANLQVQPRLRVRAQAGKQVVIKAERSHRAATYITCAGEQCFEVPVWSNGESVTYTVPEGVTVLWLGYRETRYATGFPGTFHCSDALLNRLWDKCGRSMLVNIRDTYMDCPDRERSQWPGDMANTATSGYYVFDRSVDRLFQKAMREFLAWQTGDGVLWGAVPAGRFRGKFREFPAQSLAAIAVGLPHHIEQTGDMDLARTAVPRIRRYLLGCWKTDEDGLPIPRPVNTDWEDGTGNWMDWGAGIDPRLLETVWYGWGLKALDQVREWAGLPADAEVTARRQSVSAAFDRVFWDRKVKAYRTPGYTEQPDDRGNALAVCAGLAPPRRQEALVALLTQTHLASNYMERYPVEALFLLEQPHAALKRLLRRYEADIRAPYSTLPEFFGQISNHGWGAWPATTMVSRVAGIRPLRPGYEEFLVDPRPGGLTHIAVRFMTVRGEISVTWKETGTQARLLVECPPQTSATIVVPETRPWREIEAPGITLDSRRPARFKAGPGRWTIICCL